MSPRGRGGDDDDVQSNELQANGCRGGLLSGEPWATVADTGVLATWAVVPVVDDRDGEIVIANERFARSLGLF
jgi:hypothetical protein